MRSILVLFLVSTAMLGLALTAGCTSESADAGPTEKNVFDVQGMTCDGCAGTVRTAVEKLPGVKSCDVSWQKNEVVVVADPKVAGSETILAAIAGTGYEVKVAGEESGEPAEPEGEDARAEPAPEGEPAPEPPAA